jgi:CheY-like chemotaxis protein
VDDDPLGLELVEEVLTDAGFHVIPSTDGETAWAALERGDRAPDAVVTDRYMPGLDGIELLGRIKQDDRFAAVPVIMVTAASERQEILEGIDAGAYYYVTKPLDREMLVAMTRAAVSDFARYKSLQREVHTDADTLALVRDAVFDFRTPEQASNLGALLAKACPEPERVVLGLTELLVNAVEHGNLEISYEEKTDLTRDGRLHLEIERRLGDPRYADRTARVRLRRVESGVEIVIRDQGAGFDPQPFLNIDPARVFDSHGRGIAIAKLMSFDELEYRDGGREAVGRVHAGDAETGASAS